MKNGVAVCQKIFRMFIIGKDLDLIWSIALCGFGLDNLINNRAVYNRGYLEYKADNISGIELPPEFKRGYILCDGSTVKFNLSPSNIVSNASELSSKSLGEFFNLFYTIGYYYVPTELINPCMGIHRCIKDTNEDQDKNIKYKYWNPNSTSIEGSGHSAKFYPSIINPNVVYTIDMATILVFKAFDNQFNINKKTFDSTKKALEWLETQTIDENYIFNSIIPEELSNSLPNDYYLYTNDSINEGKEKIKINIGRQISDFTDEIPYYEYNAETKEYSLVKCRICDTAEARDIADRFVEMGTKGLSSTNLKDWDAYYTYSYAVPKLYSETSEGDEYLAKNYNKETLEKAVFGNFIGSNGLILADSITIKRGNINETIENLDKCAHTFKCNYRNSVGNEPHVHAIGKGSCKISFIVDADGKTETEWGTLDKTFKPLSNEKINNAIESFTKVNYISETDSETTGYKYHIYPNKEINSDIDGAFNKPEYILKTDFRGTPKYTNKQDAINSLMNNYILFETPSTGENLTNEDDIYKINVVNTFTGTLGKEWYNGDKFVWYGRTSEPIWINGKDNSTSEKFEYFDGTTDDGREKPGLINNYFVGYFRPESVKVLPLIKL